MEQQTEQDVFKIKMWFVDNFNEQGFLINIAHYSCTGFMSAYIIIEALKILCKEYTVTFNKFSYTPVQWQELVSKRRDIENKDLKQKTLLL